MLDKLTYFYNHLIFLYRCQERSDMSFKTNVKNKKTKNIEKQTICTLVKDMIHYNQELKHKLHKDLIEKQVEALLNNITFNIDRIRIT